LSEQISEIELALLNRWPETRIEPSLERISLLSEMLGSPQFSYPTIHIAGTNGKTTTTRAIDALCLELGLRTGRFTSPHLESFLERISINGEPISESAMIATYRDVAPYLDLTDQRMTNRLSFFEAITALAFVAFAEFPVDVGIFECGMGGEWDATNVIDAKVSVVTPIDLDHMQYLGNTLGEIAATKSGIIKPGSFAVFSRQERDPAQVLLRKCAEVGATPIREGVEFSVTKRSLAVGGQLLTIKGVYGEYEDLFLPLHGEHQASNAAVALAAVEVFASETALDIEVVRAAFAAMTSPGRCEILMRNPTVIVDAAHNPHGAKSLRKTIESEFDFDAVIGIVSAMGDKDLSGIFEELEPIMDRVIVTRNSSQRSAPVEQLADIAREIFSTDRVSSMPDLKSAILAGLEQARLDFALNDRNCALLLAGSVISAGEAKEIIREIGAKK
jgi:dihydrofolate synthase/folylpolyglutamate synthase